MTCMSKIFPTQNEGRDLSQADPVGFSRGRLERAGGRQVDGRADGIHMTPIGGGPKYLRTLCWQGTHQCSAFFCALWNLPDCAQLEMLQTDFRREMPRSGSFVGVRELPHPFGVGNPDDFGKNVRVGSLRCVRA